MPVVEDRKKEGIPVPLQSIPSPRETEDKHFRYTVTYSRTGDICYLGHLEILQLVFRCLRRAKIKTNFSKGFNPSPKVSFGPALPVGTQSHAEFFVMDLPEPLTNTKATQSALNEQLVAGLQIEDISLTSSPIPQQLLCSYQIRLPQPLSAEDLGKIDIFLSKTEFTIERSRKGKIKEINIRPLVASLKTHKDNSITLDLISRASEAGVKPLEAMAAILEIEQKQLLSAEVIKTKWQELSDPVR